MVLGPEGWIIIAAAFVLVFVAAHFIGIWTDPTREARRRSSGERPRR